MTKTDNDNRQRSPWLKWRSYVCALGSILNMVGLRKGNKVFAIGLNKTGSSSIDHLFTDLGYHADHSILWTKTRAPIRQLAFDAFSDGDAHFFASYDKRFPGSKFILNVRDLDSWMDSRLNHITYAMHHDPGFRSNKYWGLSDDVVRGWILRHHNHHLKVLKYFASRPDDLLVINFIRDPDASAKIANFLGFDVVPDKPHVHPIPVKRDQTQLKFKEQISRLLTESNIPESEWSYDLLCPSLIENPEDKFWMPDTSMRFD